MTDHNAPHDNETMHDPDAVTRPEQHAEEGRFDIGEGVSGVAQTDADPDASPGTTEDAADAADAEFDDARRSIEGTGEDRDV